MYSKSKVIAYILCVVMVACIAYAAFDANNKPQSSGTVSEDTSDVQSTPQKTEVQQDYFTVCSHDVGYYNYSTDINYRGPDTVQMLNKWADSVKRTEADFYLCQEYHQYFDPDHTMDARDSIYKPCYANLYQHSNSFGSVAAMSDKHLVDLNKVELTSKVEGFTETNRPAVICSTKINSKVRIWLASFTLFLGDSNPKLDEARAQQLEMLLDNRWIKNSNYAIIGGNFNSTDSRLREILEENGFQICVNETDLDTINSGKGTIDNIAVKGFEVLEAQVLPEEACSSNHYPITAKLKIKTND